MTKLLRSVAVWIVVSTVAFVASARASDLGTVQLRSAFLPIGLPPGVMTDVWGWVDGNGREYVLIGTWLGDYAFYLYDVTDPDNPVFKSLARGSPGFDVKVYQNYAYAVNGGQGPPAGIYDLQEPTSVQKVGDIPSSHNLFVDPRGYLYQCDIGNGELQIFDLNPDPLHPTLVWEDNYPRTHDASVVGTTLYDFHGFKGLLIYDVTDPSSPVQIGQVVEPGIFYHSGYPTEDGKHVFICDEMAEHPQADITVWNIEDPWAPTKVGEIADPIASAHNLYIIGNYAYVSHYAAGFRVYDVSDPTQPQLADEFDTSAYAEEGWLGAFGVYPFTPSGNIYVSDVDTGLYVFTFTPPTITAVVFAYVDAQAAGNGVNVEWGIESADDLQGFNVYRSLRRDDGYRQLNERMIRDLSTRAYRDASVEGGRTFWYRVGAVDRDGEFFSAPIQVSVPEWSVVLHQNAPNPFNPTTTISYELPHASDVALEVFAADGRHVRTLVRGAQPAGHGSAAWDGRDAAGRAVASGVYFYRLSMEGVSLSRRMLLLK